MSAAILLQTFTEMREKSFEWGYLPPAWVIFLVVVPLVVLYVSAFYRRERPGGPLPPRWIPGALRTAAILGILVLLARPLARETLYRMRDPRILVLADDSLSMKIQDKYADRSVPRKIGDLLRMSLESAERTGRYDLVARALRSRDLGFIESLRKRGRVEVWSFAGRPKKLLDLERIGSDSGMVPREGEEPAGLPEIEKVQGEERVKQTRIGDSLSEVVWGGRGPFSARDDPGSACAIVFTDGQQNAGNLQPEDVARKMGQRGIPIYAVGVGNPEQPRDVRVASFESGDVVLVGDRVSFDANLIADGFEGDRVRVDLVFDGDVADTQYVTLEGRGILQPVRLSHVPRRPGDFTATVKVEPLPSELFEENNVSSRPVKVLDQKIKVLYLEGPPRWEYRYLMHALIRDPTMEAQVLLYSADRGFIQDSSPGVPPLTSFPESRESLFRYHVVILGDVDPDTDKLTAQQMELLRDFVAEAGGGMVFIAGQNANPSRYPHTPLEQLLPVEVAAAGIGAGEPRSPTAHFNAKLTGVGKEHPTMRLDNDPERNVELWENPLGLEGRGLPPFFWFAEVNREKKGAVKLAVHPTQGHPIYGPWVIFAFQNFGKGRTFFSAVDNTWRWRAGVDNLYFYKFWGQTIRFAASGRLLGKTPRFSITTDKLTYTIGDKINISCHVYDANMKPATDETIQVYHLVEGAGDARLKAPEPITLPLNRIKGPGSYEGAISADQLGRHDLWLGTPEERQDTRTITVEVPALEFRDIRMNRELLRKMAELSGGKYYDFPECQAVLEDLEGIAKPRQAPIEDRLDDLWDNIWALLILTALLAGEWICRKMMRLM